MPLYHFAIFLLFLLFSTPLQSQKPVDATEIITINGIRQYIRIIGKDDSKPLLLVLHGGPGSSLMRSTDKITGRLQQHFVVVQWDQRETGETLRLNKTNETLTLELFFRDTHDLIDTLLKRYQRPKLYLAGYSWGTVPGFQMAARYPQLLYAYIAVSPVINNRKSDSISLALLKEKMGSRARKELAQVTVPFENAGQLYYHRKWLMKMEGQKFASLALRKDFVLHWAETWFTLWKSCYDINLFQSLPFINCPVYFFAGENDYITNAGITREYFKKVSAPKKDLFLFKDTGHGIPETHPEFFQDLIIEKILPETKE